MTAFDALKENLSRLSGEQTRLTDLALYELSELARITAEKTRTVTDAGERERLFAHALVSATEGVARTNASPKAYLPFTAATAIMGFSLGAAAFAVFLCEHIKNTQVLLPWQERRIRSPRIAYVKNARADEVFLALSARTTGVTVSYAERAEDALRAAVLGKTDYALLPYAVDGERLPAVASLVRKDDLMISALITKNEGEERFSYALFSKEVAPLAWEEPTCLDIRVTADDFSALGTVFSMFPVFGFSQMNFLREREEYGRACGRVTLTGNGNLPALWLYFSFVSVGASFLGRYPCIEFE